MIQNSESYAHTSWSCLKHLFSIHLTSKHDDFQRLPTSTHPKRFTDITWRGTFPITDRPQLSPTALPLLPLRSRPSSSMLLLYPNITICIELVQPSCEDPLINQAKSTCHPMSNSQFNYSIARITLLVFFSIYYYFEPPCSPSISYYLANTWRHHAY